MALTRRWIPSPNYGSRGNNRVRLIVIHTAEGSTSIESLGSYFANRSSGVSSHVGIDDKANVIGEYVNRNNSAWTQANANPVSVAAELCGFARWSTNEWRNNHRNMLNNCAAWIKEEASRYGIPIVKLTPQQAQSNKSGVCAHSDLGTWGGNHSDPGPGFPWSDVLQGGTIPPQPPTGGIPALHVDGIWIGHNDRHPDVRVWQAKMSARNWSISVDGQYGPGSDNVCRQFQREKGLGVDGKVGPNTWRATWTAPVT